MITTQTYEFLLSLYTVNFFLSQLRFQRRDLFPRVLLETGHRELLFSKLRIGLFQLMAKEIDLGLPIFFGALRRLGLADCGAACSVSESCKLIDVVEQMIGLDFDVDNFIHTGQAERRQRRNRGGGDWLRLGFLWKGSAPPGSIILHCANKLPVCVLISDRNGVRKVLSKSYSMIFFRAAHLEISETTRFTMG
ncbi:MAG: hypothetical protein ACREP5_13875, partial [Candidatus Binatia bacterium]